MKIVILLVTVFALGCAGAAVRVCNSLNYEQFAAAFVCPATPDLDPETDAALITAACEHASRAVYHAGAAACIGTGTVAPGAFPL